MGKFADLLRWKKEVEIKDPQGNVIEHAYIRIIGDYDLQESFRLARIASTKRRAKLRDITSEEYEDEVSVLDAADLSQCVEIITTARMSLFEAEAASATTVPDLPELEEVAIDPDAPTLEEQEKLDTRLAEVEAEYQKQLNEYIETKRQELIVEIGALSLEQAREMAKEEISNVLALGAFMDALNNERLWRATYVDKAFKERAFDSVEEFKNAASYIRTQLIEAYQQLEIGPDELKN
jgi:hypothetical protein